MDRPAKLRAAPKLPRYAPLQTEISPAFLFLPRCGLCQAGACSVTTGPAGAGPAARHREPTAGPGAGAVPGAVPGRAVVEVVPEVVDGDGAHCLEDDEGEGAEDGAEVSSRCQAGTCSAPGAVSVSVAVARFAVVGARHVPVVGGGVRVGIGGGLHDGAPAGADDAPFESEDSLDIGKNWACEGVGVVAAAGIGVTLAREL